MNKLFGWLLGFRKFVVMILFLITMILFRVYNLIDGIQFAENLQLSVVAFFGSNLGEHIVKTAANWIKGKNNDN